MKIIQTAEDLILILSKHKNFAMKIYSDSDGVEVPLIESDIDIDVKEKSIIIDYNHSRFPEK